MTYSEQQIQFAADELMKSIKAIMGGSALTRPWPDSERSRFEELAKRVLDASGIGATLAHVQGSDVAMIELLQKAREERDAAIKEHAHAAKQWEGCIGREVELVKTLEQAGTCLRFAFNRIEGLPRSRDTELARDIGKVRAQIAAALKGEKSK